MHPITFPQANTTIAKDQPEFEKIPTDLRKIEGQTTAVCCFQLTPQEIAEIRASGVIWLIAMPVGGFMPMILQTEYPYSDEPFRPGAATPVRFEVPK